MTDKQPDALLLADEADTAEDAGYTSARKANAYYLCLLSDCSQMMRRQHAEIEALRTGYAAAPTAQPAPQQEAQEPVAGQCRFPGAVWSECSPEHVRMVLANPEEWKRYEVRYLYTAPPPAPAAQGDALESEYQRGYRHGYEQRDAEVRGALV